MKEMKKLLVMLLLLLTISLSACGAKEEYQLKCTVSGAGTTTTSIYLYNEEELHSITIDGRSYNEIATEQTLFSEIGMDAYIDIQYDDNQGTFSYLGFTFTGVCTESIVETDE
jgi:uncharacterized lipoprotein YehR (DUF1307 family)